MRICVLSAGTASASRVNAEERFGAGEVHARGVNYWSAVAFGGSEHEGKTMRSAHGFETSLGRCRIHWKDARLVGFELPPLQQTPVEANETSIVPEWVAEVASRVERHLEGERQDFAMLPFAWERVTDFERVVLQAALTIKAGTTCTYGALAVQMGLPKNGARAVGAALGRNPWPLLVPCHRIVGAGGKMTGFSALGGVATKLRLLAIEGAELFAV